MTDRLRDSLNDLADAVEPADLYDRAVRRSSRIARKETTIGTVAALVALALLASGLWRLPHDDDATGPPLALRPAPTALEPAPSPMPSATRHTSPPAHHAGASASSTSRRKNQPQAAASTPTPESRMLGDLPGRVFYQRTGADHDVVRLTPGDGAVKTVLPDAPSPVGISPDGNSIAYAKGDALLVAHTAGGEAEQVATGVSTSAQAPTWSPDGARLLINASTPAVLQVGSRTLTPLAVALADGRHFRWSGDGAKLVYATSYCGLMVTADGTDTVVPVIGDRQPVDNPDGLAACMPTSVDVTGDRVTVPLRNTDDTGDHGPDTADAVVDTVTGDVVPLPVDGSVVGAVFAPDGNLLVRTRRDDVTRLSLFTPAGTLLVQAIEPAGLRGLDLLTYTR
jgi:TolB protein